MATSATRTGSPGPGHAHGAHALHAHDGPDPRTDDILKRLKSVEGHVRGVARMVEEGTYCVDVLNQILAVQRALQKVSGRVLDHHLHTCVTSAVRSEDPDERERVLEEIMEVFGKSGRV